MFLNRLTAHLKDQNWFAVSLDLVIVVAGIFIALQVNDWKLALENTKKEKHYIDRLRNETEESINKLINLRDFHQSNSESLKSIIADLQQDDFLRGKIDKDTFHRGICRWFIPLNVSIELKTYEELLFTAQLTLITEQKIRDALFNFYSDLSLLKAQYQSSSYFTEVGKELRPYIKWRTSDHYVGRQNCDIDYEKLYQAEETIPKLALLESGEFYGYNQVNKILSGSANSLFSVLNGESK